MWIIVDNVGAIDTGKIAALTVESSPERDYNATLLGNTPKRFSVDLFQVVAHIGNAKIAIRKFSKSVEAFEYIRDLVTDKDW